MHWKTRALCRKIRYVFVPVVCACFVKIRLPLNCHAIFYLAFVYISLCLLITAKSIKPRGLPRRCGTVWTLKTGTVLGIHYLQFLYLTLLWEVRMKMCAYPEAVVGCHFQGSAVRLIPRLPVHPRLTGSFTTTPRRDRAAVETPRLCEYSVTNLWKRLPLPGWRGVTPESKFPGNDEQLSERPYNWGLFC
jgi:hypothetical protein